MDVRGEAALITSRVIGALMLPHDVRSCALKMIDEEIPLFRDLQSIAIHHDAFRKKSCWYLHYRQF